MDTPAGAPRPLVAPEVDAVALFKRAEELFADGFTLERLVAASPVRALFVARDVVLKRRVGLRVHVRPDAASRRWFERETELLAALDHPGLRDVYTAGARADWVYRAVKWIEGESLADACARGPRPVPGTLQLARFLATTLDYIHAQGIVIRHLAPTNVMLDNTERPWLTDLRFANVLLDVATGSPDPSVVPYMAPETRGGEPGDPGSDIYSAGALLYFAVTGAPPDEDPARLAPPRERREACPRALERVVKRALRREPRERYLTAIEMLDDLRSDLGDHDTPISLGSDTDVPSRYPEEWEKQLRRALGDDYELLGELGSGGFGRVYRVRDLRLEREVALKVLHPYLTTDPAVVERFRREARLAAQVVHPNIANTYGFGGRAGLIWYTMEFVRGKSLAHLVHASGPLEVSRVADLLRQSLSGLGYAHSRGLIHRDLKPENLLIEDATGTLRIADFGLAVQPTPGLGFGGASAQSGTPEYAAPEQLLGEPVDHRADFYSLSLVAYFSLTGELPFQGATIEAIVAGHSAGLLPDITAVRDDVPEQFRRVLERGAARDPGQRFMSADAYAQALDDALRADRGLFSGFLGRMLGSN
ncbi:MAG: serine/threonine-protein kinase [Gemmatimonadales bacterium]|jgi:serine/threonine protein kinase